MSLCSLRETTINQRLWSHPEGHDSKEGMRKSETGDEEANLRWGKLQFPAGCRAYLLCQGLHGGDVHAASLRVLEQHPQDGKFSTNGLSASRGGTHKHIVVTVINCVKHWGQTDNTEESSLRKISMDFYQSSRNRQGKHSPDSARARWSYRKGCLRVLAQDPRSKTGSSLSQ